MKFLQQHQETVRADGPARKIEQVLNDPGVAVRVAFDRDEISAFGKNGVGRAAQFDVLVGQVGAGRIQENFIDEQFGRRVPGTEK